MKKFINMLIAISLVLITIIVIQRYQYKDFSLYIAKSGLKYSIVYKGLRGAVDFTMDENGNYYIAYKDRIQFINSKGRNKEILKDKYLNISSIEYYKGCIYYASNTEIHCYNLKNNTKSIVVKDIPNFGDYNKTIIKINGGSLYASIGSATNSGVCGSDNLWLSNNFYGHDIPAKDITLSGINFGEEKTGAFSAYKTKTIKGQMVPGHFPSNGSVIVCNLNDGYAQTYAWGIRNINGMDFNASSKVIATVGGMEDRGLRPVKGDTDYIYEIKKDVWYGWPDYSGGDPINSPKFKGKNNQKIPFVLDNHISTNPPAPIYQHKTVNTLKALAIDAKGLIGEINEIYFYDSSENIIYSLGKSVVPKEVLKINSEDSISKMKFVGGSMKLLEENKGVLISVETEIPHESIKITKGIICYLLICTIAGIIIVIILKNKDM